jgi:hypothetical protein
MPLAVVVMLQSTIADAWADYEGDPNNPGEFWAYLAGTDD